MYKFQVLVSLFAAIASAVPQGTYGDVGFACGNPEPTAEQLGQLRGLMIEEEQNSGNFTELAVIDVAVHFHVVAESMTLAGGWVTDAQLDQQFTVLKNNFADHAITFHRAGTTRTINANWANNINTDRMWAALRAGPYRDLNIYIMKNVGEGLAGVCSFPRDVSGQVTNDQCQIVAPSLPGGGAANGFNDGKTAVHEVGHWFGLLHTFQGGCDGDGDLIADTPAEASPPNGGCPTGRDSCPNKPGTDPIHNHMDYTGGACRTRFTPNQQTRMHNQFDRFRAGK